MLTLLSRKNGVSPLIATILLIAFAVALGSVIMNWGLNLAIDSSKDKCRGVEITLQDMVNTPFCYGGSGERGYINFIVSNSGSVDIAGISIWLTGEKKTELIDINDVSIPRGLTFEKRTQDLAYDPEALGQLHGAQFIPKIRNDGKTEICTNKAIEPRKITVC